MRRPALVSGALSLTLLACDAGAGTAAPPRPRSTAPHTKEQLAPIAGLERVDAAALKAKLRAPGATRGSIVNVWASWCGSCRDEIPMLLQLSAAFAPEGLGFAFVSADQPADQARAIELMASWKGPSPVLAIAGPLPEFKRALTPKWRGAIPATFLFDGQGALRYFWEGPILEEEIAPILQRFLAGDVVDGELRTAGGPN